MDDPANSDLLMGRTLNQFIFSNLIWQVSDELRTGVELSWWRTLYQDQREGLIDDALLGPLRPGRAYTFEWMVRYDF